MRISLAESERRAARLDSPSTPCHRCHLINAGHGCPGCCPHDYMSAIPHQRLALRIRTSNRQSERQLQRKRHALHVLIAFLTRLKRLRATLRDAGIFPATTGFLRHDQHAQGNTVSHRKIEARADTISLSRIKLGPSCLRRCQALLLGCTDEVLPPRNTQTGPQRCATPVTTACATTGSPVFWISDSPSTRAARPVRPVGSRSGGAVFV